MPDPPAALRQLAALAKPGGKVLAIEASAKMSGLRALSLALSGASGRRAYMLPLWAMVRAGRTLPDAVFDRPGLTARRHPLLRGLANAWIVERSA
jgi:hypothetical protein